MTPAQVSEVYLADARQLNAEIQAFAAGQRRGLRQVALSATALADLLGSLGFANCADCMACLAAALQDDGGTSRIDAVAGAARELAGHVDGVIAALVTAQPVDDDPEFARRWLARHRPQPLAAAAPSSPDDFAQQNDAGPLALAAAGAVSAEAPSAAGAPAAVAVPFVEHADVLPTVSPPLLDTPEPRDDAVRRARRSHLALPRRPAGERAAWLADLRDTLRRSHRDVSRLGGHVLAGRWRLAPELDSTFDAALASLQQVQAIQAFEGPEACGLAVQCAEPPRDLLHRLWLALSALGGRVDAVAGGLTLSAPRDPRCFGVLPVQQAEGWVAISMLQLDGPPPAADVDGEAAQVPCHAGPDLVLVDARRAGVPQWAWIDPLPEHAPSPPGWLAVACTLQGQVMPVVRPETLA